MKYSVNKFTFKTQVANEYNKDTWLYGKSFNSAKELKSFLNATVNQWWFQMGYIEKPWYADKCNAAVNTIDKSFNEIKLIEEELNKYVDYKGDYYKGEEWQQVQQAIEDYKESRLAKSLLYIKTEETRRSLYNPYLWGLSKQERKSQKKLGNFGYLRVKHPNCEVYNEVPELKTLIENFLKALPILESEIQQSRKRLEELIKEITKEEDTLANLKINLFYWKGKQQEAHYQKFKYWHKANLHNPKGTDWSIYREVTLRTLNQFKRGIFYNPYGEFYNILVKQSTGDYQIVTHFIEDPDNKDRLMLITDHNQVVTNSAKLFLIKGEYFEYRQQDNDLILSKYQMFNHNEHFTSINPYRNNNIGTLIYYRKQKKAKRENKS